MTIDDEDPSQLLLQLLSIGAMLRKRKELALRVSGKMRQFRKELIEIDVIDATARTLDPNLGIPAPPVLVPLPMGRIVFDLQSALIEPAGKTTSQITIGLMRQRDVPTTDLGLVRRLNQNVSLILHQMAADGDIDSELIGDQPRRWMLSEKAKNRLEKPS